MYRYSFAMLACLILGAGTISWSQDNPDAIDETESTLLARQAALAYELADIGRAHKMPESLISAALILHRVGATPGTEKPLDGELVNDNSNSPAALLEEAKKIRPEDKSVMDLIARAADELKEKSRGVVGGPKSYPLRFTAGKVQSWKFKVEAKKPLIVHVRANTEPQSIPPKPASRAAITIEFFNANGAKIASGGGQGEGQVGFVPPTSTEIIVKVTTKVNAVGMMHTN